MRLAGYFGGYNAAGRGWAPYFWPQSGLDPEAAAKAGIMPRPFIQDAEKQFDIESATVFSKVFA